jgi:hypothetical protein
MQKRHIDGRSPSDDCLPLVPVVDAQTPAVRASGHSIAAASVAVRDAGSLRQVAAVAVI